MPKSTSYAKDPDALLSLTLLYKLRFTNFHRENKLVRVLTKHIAVGDNIYGYKHSDGNF